MYKITLKPAELKKLNERRKQERNKEISDRLNCIYLSHIGKGNREIVKALAVNKNSVTNWIKIYIDKGIDELCQPENYDRRSSKMDEYIESIKKDISNNSISTLAELQNWLAVNYSLILETSWLWRCCKKNSICLAKKRA